MLRQTGLLAAAAALALAVQIAPAAAQTAKADLKNAQGQSVGSATLKETPSGVLIALNVMGLPPGEHAFHVHAVGKCEPPFTSAGGHFNPGGKKHGLEAEAGHHAGDMPNLHIPQGGALSVEVLNAGITLAKGKPNSVFHQGGTAIVIHAGKDDYKSDPAGDAGARIACGVIQVGDSPREAPMSCRIGALIALTALLSVAIGDTVGADEVVRFLHQGVERTAIVHEPAEPPAPRPLVIVLHGLGGTAAGLRKWSGFDEASDRHGFVVAYPDAVDKAWSYGRPINQPMPTANGQIVDDIGFMRLLIDDLVAKRHADPARIYIAGMSRGGLMTFTLACALADRVAAVAPFITGMTAYQREDCRPARPVPIMAIAGTHDQVQSFGGAQGRVGRLLSVPETMGFWREQHGCTRRTTRTLPHRDESDRTRVHIVEWTDCASGHRMRLYRIEGGGHQLPSVRAPATPLSEERFGLRNRDIETAEETWTFVREFRLGQRGSSAQ